MKPLDCVGTVGGVGKHDFQPSGEIVHGAAQVPEASELAAVIRERDALREALSYIASGKGDGYTAAEALAKLASGELRKSP